MGRQTQRRGSPYRSTGKINLNDLDSRIVDARHASATRQPALTVTRLASHEDLCPPAPVAAASARG